jgi:hypothetical protein
MNEQPEAPLECCKTAEGFTVFTKMKWSLQEKWQQLRYALGIDKKPECNCISHAKREMQAIGYDLNQTEEDPNKWIQENVLELLEVFVKQGHSGFSAPYCIDMFAKLAKFEPLCPLTGADDEWNDVSDDCYQNNRCSHVFKEKDSGKVYDLDGYIFVDQTGSGFTSGYSRKYIEFPYIPKREYVDVICTETNKEGTVEEPGSGWWETKYPDWIVETYEAHNKLN